MVKLGIVGLGQVGRVLAEGLSERGVAVKGYDRLMDHPDGLGDEAVQSLRDAGVELLASPRHLAEAAEWIVAVTTPAGAVETAESIAPYLRAGQLYLDLNSLAPQVKERIAQIVAPAAFIDGVILGYIGQYGLQVPVTLSGPESARVASILREAGMDVRSVGLHPGQASAFKLVRTVFAKGMESLLLECLTAAQTFSIEDEILQDIVASLRQQTFPSTANSLIKQLEERARWGVHDMEQAVRFLDEWGGEHLMSVAAWKKLSGVAEKRKNPIS